MARRLPRGAANSRDGAGLARGDPVPQHTDPLDLELDLVARLEPAPVAVLQDAAGPDGAGAEDVAGPELGVPARLLDDGSHGW